MLSKHQLLHLNAIIKDCNDALNGTLESKEELSKNKEVLVGKEDNYFNKCIKDVNNIIKSGRFPELEWECLIHDYIEKETKSEFKEAK